MKTNHFLPLCLMIIVLGLNGTGCSRFQRDWRSASNTPPPAEDISGRWQGAWVSEANGHSGGLRCLITPLGADRYQARFDATFWRIFHFRHSVELRADRRNGTVDFAGEADLGRLGGGLFHYEGSATPTNFFSTYRSKKDRGIFRMQRPRARD